MTSNKELLNREFSAQVFEKERPYAEMLDRYKETACNYARMEQAIAVLSDLRTDASYIYYGRFAQTLGRRQDGKEDTVVPSVWEEEIFRLIHPDDLEAKHLQELCFLRFIKGQPKRKRGDYYLTSKLRMKSATNGYIPVTHRMFYIPAPSGDTPWLALCLYGPFLFDTPSKCLIINAANGQMTELGRQDRTQLLSAREKQVLGLIDRGLTSKEIAEALRISIHTVNRHRQEILDRLQVKNSIEACRTARDLKLI